MRSGPQYPEPLCPARRLRYAEIQTNPRPTKLRWRHFPGFENAAEFLPCKTALLAILPCPIRFPPATRIHSPLRLSITEDFPPQARPCDRVNRALHGQRFAP